MDKTILFTMISFFIICACFITWAALGESRRSYWARRIVMGYVALVWACIVILSVLVVIY